MSLRAPSGSSRAVTSTSDALNTPHGPLCVSANFLQPLLVVATTRTVVLGRPTTVFARIECLSPCQSIQFRDALAVATNMTLVTTSQNSRRGCGACSKAHNQSRLLNHTACSPRLGSTHLCRHNRLPTHSILLAALSFAVEPHDEGAGLCSACDRVQGTCNRQMCVVT